MSDAFKAQFLARKLINQQGLTPVATSSGLIGSGGHFKWLIAGVALESTPSCYVPEVTCDAYIVSLL